jgi:CDP-glycerol glycerophosphotransferase (TagB/SpsB family)
VLATSTGDFYLSGALADLVQVLDPTETLLLSAHRDDVGDGGPVDLRIKPTAARAPYLGQIVVAKGRLSDPDPDPDPDGMLTALTLLADGFTATPFRAYRDARGSKAGPFAPRVDPLPGLASHLARDRASIQALSGLAPAQTQRAIGAALGLQTFLKAAEQADASRWAMLVDHCRVLHELAADQLESIDVVSRAKLLLAAGGRRDELAALTVRRRFNNDYPTTVLDGQLVADLGVDLPSGLLVVGEEESPLVARVRRFELADGCLELELLTGVRHLDQLVPGQMTARLVGPGASIRAQVEVGLDPAVTVWLAEDQHDHDAGLVRLRFSAAELAAGPWDIELDWTDGELRRSGWVESLDRNGSAGRARIAISEASSARLVERFERVVLVVSVGVPTPRAANLTRVEVTENSLRLTVDRSVDSIDLIGHGHRVAATAGLAGFWTVPLAAVAWGLGASPLPTGSYRLVFATGGVSVPVAAAASLIDLLPAESSTPQHRVQLQLADQSVVIRLDPLLADDEIGVRAQQRLQRQFAAITNRLDERLVYFQSFTGQWANDNPLAIQSELVKHRTDLDIRWVVADSSSSVPAGSTALLFRSREWYDVMSRASYLVANIELERWFARRPGQQVLQSFHGYPSKAMGLGLWQQRGMLPSQIRTQFEHTSQVWNNLVTPTVEMDQYYRRDYAYDGRILSVGYPRNDVLVGKRLAELRALTRERLGIGPDQRAILYAPTWRDDLATNFRAAEAVHHLDVDRAAAALGDGYVLLLRGHRFHAPRDSAAKNDGSHVIDVTGHPDVNHLIAASDAAVLDYSSLRFDFALTGRPMVFLVPDLETYGSQVRGFLWDYRETTPGPLVSTTAEVVTMLRDLDGLSARWADELTAFNTRYNPNHDGHAAERVVAAFFAPLLAGQSDGRVG